MSRYVMGNTAHESEHSRLRTLYRTVYSRTRVRGPTVRHLPHDCMTDTYKTSSANGIKDSWFGESILNAQSGISKKDKILTSYVLHKTSRIAAVSHMLADHIENCPEIAGDIQRTSLRLVAYAVESVTSTKARQQFLHEVLRLITLLETGVCAELFRADTVGVVADDVIIFIRYLEDHGWMQGYAVHPDHYPRVEAPSIADDEEGAPGMSVMKARSADAGHADSAVSSRVRDIERDKPKQQQREHFASVQKDRRASILGLLQRIDRITVKDVTAVVTGCSEKTLQRELLALVAQGVLVKEGERRWSTYRLA